MVGPGWKSTIRRTWQVFLVYGVAAILLDVASGRPGRAGGATQTVLVAVGALVGLANIALGGARTSPELRVLRAGYFVFLAMVVHDGLVFLGLSALVASVRGGPDALLSAVIEALAGFAGRTEAFDDDCTLVALEVGS